MITHETHAHMSISFTVCSRTEGHGQSKESTKYSDNRVFISVYRVNIPEMLAEKCYVVLRFVVNLVVVEEHRPRLPPKLPLLL